MGMAGLKFSRAFFMAAGARVGSLIKIYGRILQIAVNVADVYGNFAYNIAAAWDAHDKIPNNGRINF